MCEVCPERSYTSIPKFKVKIEHGLLDPQVRMTLSESLGCRSNIMQDSLVAAIYAASCRVATGSPR